MVEVDELQLAQSTKLKQAFEALMKNPKSRRKVLEAQKIIEPDAKIPELEQPDPIEAVQKASDEKIAALEKKFEDEKAARERDGRLAQLQTLKDNGIKKLREQRYTDDGIKAVEKIMEDKGILDPLDAAAIFERDHPPQAPVQQTGSGGWNFGELPSATDDADEKYVDQLLKAGKNGISDGALMNRVSQTINEVRGNARR
jgi:ribosome assembly protein YihI (activator of Der GTPase)